MQNFFITNRTGAIPEILVYGYICDDEVNAGDFIRELRLLENESAKINVRINSGGGSVFDGIAIYNAIKNSKAEIETYIDGLAASMGSVIALAGKKVHMSKMARMMTHRASGFAAGDAESMRQTAALMESLEETIAAIYASKSGLTQVEAKAKFLKEDDNWMTAQQALDAKLVDTVFDANTVDIPVTAKTDKEVWNVFNKVFPIQINNNNMNQIFLTAEQLVKLNLKVDAKAPEVAVAFDALVAKAATVDSIQAKLDKANGDLKALKDATDAETIETVAKAAINAKKGTVEFFNQLKEDYKGNPEGFKKVVAAMPAYSGIVASLNDDSKKTRLGQLVAKSWNELDKDGNLEELKSLSIEDFKNKFKAQFGKEYMGK